MVGQGLETLCQLQRRQEWIDPAGRQAGEQQFGQGEYFAGKHRRRALAQHEDHHRAEQGQQLEQQQERRTGLIEPENFSQAGHQRITTKVAITAIIK